MAVSRKLITWTIVAAGILAIALGVFFSYRMLAAKRLQPMAVVPQNTVVLIRPLEIKNLSLLHQQAGKILDELAVIPLATFFVTEMQGAIKSIERNREINGLTGNNELLLAWVSLGDTTLAPLLLVELKNLLEEQSMQSFLDNNFKTGKGKNGFDELLMATSNGDQHGYYLISNGVLRVSPSQEAIEMSVRQANNTVPAFSDPAFSEIIATSGKNVDANIFADVSLLIRILTGNKQAPTPAVTLGDYASLDLSLDNQAIVLNGFIASKNHISFDYLLKDEQAGNFFAPSVLPQSTSEFLCITFSNADTLLNRMINTGRLSRDGENTSGTAESSLKHFSRWASGEICLANSAKAGHMVLFRTAVEQSVPPELEKSSTLTETYLGVAIRSFNYPSAVSQVLGALAEKAAYPIFIRLGDFIIFTGSPETARQIINEYTRARTLDRDIQYGKAQLNVTQSSNLYYYYNLEEILQEPENTLLSRQATRIKDEGGAYRHFPSFTAQFSSSGKWLYANLALQHTDSVEPGGPYLWQFVMDSEVASGPGVVNIKGNERVVYVSDKKDKLYVVKTDGELSWSRQLDAPLVGGLTAILDGISGTSFVFNTTASLYMTDLYGNDRSGFPVSISAGTEVPVEAVCYPEKAGYRFLLPCQDQKIYNWDDHGNYVKGWIIPSLKEQPASTPQYFTQKKKDYLVFDDKMGNVLITDRRGKERIKIQGEFLKAVHSKLYLNQTNSKGFLITTNQEGHLTYISDKGKIQHTVFGDFSPGHYFFYTDLDGNGNEDFIYFDNGKVQAFDRLKHKLLDLELPEIPASTPLKLQMQSKRNSFIFQGNSGILYLVDPKGEVYFEREWMSDRPAAAWVDGKEGTINILTATSNKVTLFSLSSGD